MLHIKQNEFHRFSNVLELRIEKYRILTDFCAVYMRHIANQIWTLEIDSW